MTYLTLSRIALATATLLAANAHAAPLQNGSFGAGLSNWTSVGDVAVVTGTHVGHDFGSSTTLVLGTASLSGEDDAPAAAGTYNVSGTSAVLAAQANGAEANLNLSAGAFASATGADDAVEASSVSQNFFLNAGDTISFTWQVLTRDGYAGNGDTVNDSAWVAFSLAAVPQVAPTVTQTKLGDIGTLALSAVGADGWRVSGWQTFTFTATGGTARLGWGVNDMLDSTGTTLLAIQNVTVQTAAVPEPTSWLLALAGVVGIIGMSGTGAMRRRQG